MSKRAEQKVLEAYPYNRVYTDNDVEHNGNFCNQLPYIEGYEKAEKDTIERVCEWLKKNATYIHPRKGIKTCMINLNALREAILEEE